MYTCRISGLNVASEIELPGVVPVPLAPDTEDVLIRQRPVPERLENPSQRGPVWELDDHRFLLQIPGIVRLLASDGRTLDIEPEPGTNPADAIPFLLGTGFGALLLQRGGLVLHAAAVALDGRAYIFCGRSGIGKSTLAAALCRAGCRFVNDDVCSVALAASGRPVLWPDGRRLKLFDEAIEHLGLDGRQRGLVRSDLAKHYVEPPGIEADTSVPLSAVYILRNQESSDAGGIEKLSAINSAQALLNQTYRPRIALAMARCSRQVVITAAVLKHAPVFRLTRTRNLDLLPATVSELLAHWNAL